MTGAGGGWAEWGTEAAQTCKRNGFQDFLSSSSVTFSSYGFLLQSICAINNILYR